MTLVTDIAPQMNILESADLEFQEVTMSLLHQTDVFQPEQKAARKHHEYGFALALICVALAVVVASVMFIDAFRPNGPTSALAASTVDPFAMMTSAKDLPTSHYDDYSVVFN